jgi:hypothetical protein
VRAIARSQRVSAAKFRALGWQPAVPSRRQGWPRAFREAEERAWADGR